MNRKLASGVGNRLPAVATPRQMTELRQQAMVGTIDEVRAHLAHERDRGVHVVGVSRPRPTPDGRLYVHITMLEPIPQPAPAALPWRPWYQRGGVVAGVATGALAVLCGGGYLLYRVVMAALSSAASAAAAAVPTLLGFGFMALVVVGLLSRGGRTFSGTFKGRID